MRLRETILAEHSKANTSRIVNWVGANQLRFDELIHLFLNDEYRVIQRAAWPLSYIAIAHPALAKKHLPKLIKNLQNPGLHVHDAVKRNTLRLLQHIIIPKKHHGEVMNLCFDYISSPTEKAAIKAFALTVLQNLSLVYPEIKQELITIIEDRWPYETPAFKSRAKRFLRAIPSKTKD